MYPASWAFMIPCFFISFGLVLDPQGHLGLEVTLILVDNHRQDDDTALDDLLPELGDASHACDIPVSTDLEQFNRDYRKLTGQVHESGENYELGEDYMVIGTSALARYEIDGALNIYAGCYNNPFLIWGKYRKKWLRANLPVSFQFHHTQLDGIPAAEFLERLQEEIRKL